MKKILFLILLLYTTEAYAQPCKVHNSETYGINFSPNPLHPEGISTHWNQPYNPNVPSSRFLNDFNWTAINGQTGNLAMIPLSGMNYLIDDLIASPYDPANNYDNLVSGLGPENLDFRWEDGWELLAMNRGYYPDGTNVLSVNEQPLFPTNPTLLFYNKQRGLIRLFSNFLGPLELNPHTVRITLAFRNSDSAPVTGLLRVIENIDKPLNYQTNAVAVTNVVNFENNDNLWFYTDFFVGYDPCSCLQHSEIEVIFDLINTQNIKLVSNTLGVEYDLIDASGAMNADLDFLASTKYNEATGFGQAGAQIYSKMQDLTDQYRLELRKIQRQNSQIAASNAEIEKKLAIVDAIGVVMKLGTVLIPMAGGAAAVSSIAATAASAEVAAQVITSSEQTQTQLAFVSRISNLPLTNPDVVEEVSSNGNIKIDSKKLFDKGSKILGIGLDSYSKSLKKKIQEPLPKPKSPVAMMLTSTYDGNITDWATNGSIKLWTPGVYPFAETTAQLSQSTFPVYNETLGLFAVMRDPKLDVNRTTFNTTVASQVGTFFSPAMIGNLITIEQNHETAMRVSLDDEEGILYTFNPAAGIDFNHPDFGVELALVINGTYNDASSVTIQGKYFNLTSNPTVDVVTLNNVDLQPSFGINEIKPGQFKMQSEFLPIDVFKTMVSGFQLNLNHKWQIATGYNTQIPLTTPEDMRQIFRTLYPDQSSNWNHWGLDLTYQIKVKLNLPFAKPGYGTDESNTTTQVFTYDVPSSAISNVGPISSFSLTQNPNLNGLPLTENLYFPVKSWSTSDFTTYGGVPMHPRPYAWNEIVITGNQIPAVPNLDVTFTAQNEVRVIGDVVISSSQNADFVLRVDDFVGFTSIPSPPVTNSFLESYCTGFGPNNYNADTPTRSAQETAQHLSAMREEKVKSQEKLELYPNPANNALNLKIWGLEEITRIDVYSNLGVLVKSFEKSITLDSLQSFLNFNVADLPNGAYNLVVVGKNDSTLTEKFFIVR